jgi:hypothetical protein
MKHSPLRNYAGIPGLTSWLITNPGPRGVIRLFENERDHQEVIVPHSHRYDFQCQVLQGTVVNRIWTPQGSGSKLWENYDPYLATSLIYDGNNKYIRSTTDTQYWSFVDEKYEKGERYEMKAEEVHSIRFTRNTKVLFFEGPARYNSSVILEPIANGLHIPTFKVEPWMFQKG